MQDDDDLQSTSQQQFTHDNKHFLNQGKATIRIDAQQCQVDVADTPEEEGVDPAKFG
jgi:hypothetical protein